LSSPSSQTPTSVSRRGSRDDVDADALKFGFVRECPDVDVGRTFEPECEGRWEERELEAVAMGMGMPATGPGVVLLIEGARVEDVVVGARAVDVDESGRDFALISLGSS
jgi:hypothetical protein